MHMYTEIQGGITAPPGYLAAGIHCGIKRYKKDIAVLFSEVPAVAAATFTTNRAAAAPVLLSREILNTAQSIRGIVINSGNANACTGDRGMDDARSMIQTVTEKLGVSADQMLVSSTGIIGEYLPMDKVTTGITEAVKTLARDQNTAAAEAIMTTDTFTKEFAVRFRMNDTDVTIGGMAKGSGMIAPNMATMLAFVTSDIAISEALLKRALKTGVDRSFNSISVDGETSTNDMVLLMANGTANNILIDQANTTEFVLFSNALEYVLTTLAKMIVVDGEGATKLIEIEVNGADSELSARAACRAIGNSNLVKTAIHGEDPNWGRILVALGYSGVPFDPREVEIYFGSVPVIGKNYTINFNHDELRKELSRDQITLTVNLNRGDGFSKFWTCDLSKEYITINAQYRT
jgi:glutamate N-acetyltransferase / amino-acid N-acetyltransferase